MALSGRRIQLRACAEFTRGMALREEKKALRKSMKSKLAQVTAEKAAEQSARITAKVLRLPVYKEANRICVFLSMPTGEVSTRDIVLDAIKNGKKVFVPYIYKSTGESSHQSATAMDMLALDSHKDLESLKPDNWGIPSLDDGSTAGRENALCGFGIHPISRSGKDEGSEFLGLDLMLLPGVAFDRENRRLGHGKGFYDRYLQRYKDFMSSRMKTRMPFLVGLALVEQLLPPGAVIPSGNDDWNVDRVITGS